MSKVAITGNASGTGVFTIAAPAGNTDRTLTLPDEAGTVLTSASSLPAANLTGSLPAGMGGKVLQVVSTTKTDTWSVATTTFTDVTGLSASITPSSSNSKILVFVNMNTSGPGTAEQMPVRLLRNSTVIAAGASAGSRAAAFSAGRNSDTGDAREKTVNFLDAPSTTSSITYKVQAYCQSGTGYVNRFVDDQDSIARARMVSSITLMEIAA